MLIRAAQRGFTLIELMVTVALMAILALLAAPAMSEYTENAKIHGTAEVFFAAVQNARTEAIRRSAIVEVALTSQAPTAENVETTGLAVAGPNWMIRQVPPTASGTHTFIEGKSGTEGGGRAGGTSTVIAASANTIQFNPMGALTSTTGVSVDFSSQSGTCATAGPMRCLRVVVSTGGQARLCDPAASGANDTRKC